MYFVKSPWLLKKYYSSCIWNIATSENDLYLTFDDGPHPEATPFVLEMLATFNAKATFFCIGKNVEKYPDIYQRILLEGHRVGNHTQNHLNGWDVPDKEYIDDVLLAARHIDSSLFRPPYGKISQFQIKVLTTPSAKSDRRFEIIMWDVLSGDFDLKLNAEQCSKNVISNAKAGSIVTFHDSEKAFPRMKKALKDTLDQFSSKGFSFRSIGKSPS